MSSANSWSTIGRGSIVLSALLLSGCATTTPPPPSFPEVATAEPELTGTPRGAINENVTQSNIGQTICVPGWTATVRPSTSYTNALKSKLLHDQGLPQSEAAKYELDHLIPLALGGHPRKPENLWLQLWDDPWGARTKDRLEVRLKNLVCSGAVSLQRARDDIRRNWVSAFKKYIGLSGAEAWSAEPMD